MAIIWPFNVLMPQSLLSLKCVSCPCTKETDRDMNTKNNNIQQTHADIQTHYHIIRWKKNSDPLNQAKNAAFKIKTLRILYKCAELFSFRYDETGRFIVRGIDVQ